VEFWLWILAGVISVLAGALTLAHPARMSKALRTSWTEDVADRPRANPLRWFYLWLRFVDARRERRALWGVFEIALGLLFFLGAFLVAQ
jgi:hypothetical protein